MSELTPDRISAEVEKTGYPLELWGASVLEEREFKVAQSLYYLDQDEMKGREVDLRALFNVRQGPKEGPHPFWVRYCLVIECKKLDKPWVFLTTRPGGYDPTFIENAVSGLPLEQRFSTTRMAVGPPLKEELERIHPYYNATEVGRTYFEAFKESDQSSRIHGAVLTVLKAFLATAKEQFAAAAHSSVCLYYPVILVDGRIFQARLNHGAIVSDEVPVSILTVHYTSPKYPAEAHRVAVVTKPAFEGFLDQMAAVHERFAEMLTPADLAAKR